MRVFKAIFDPNGDPALPHPIISQEDESDDRSDSAGKTDTDDAAEIAFWQSVEASDDDAEYSIYLERYPQGAFADLARARLRGESSVEEPGIELAFWETVRESGDPAMIRAYLDKYPEGDFKALAQILLQNLNGGVPGGDPAS